MNMNQEDTMRRTQTTSARRVVRRFAPIAFTAILGVTAAGCGSSSSPGNTPTATTTPSGATTPGATTPGATTAPESGGAGF